MQRSRTIAFVVVSVLALTLAATHLSLAQSANTSPTFVTVAFNAAVLQTAQAQQDFNDLQAKFAPRQSHLQTLNSEVEALKKQLSANSPTLSESDKNTKLRTLDSKQRQLQREADDYKADTDAATQQAFQSNAQKLYAFLQDYARLHAYTLVIDRGSDTAPVVWYAAAGIDITDQLVKDFDLKAGEVSSPANGSAKHLPSAPTPSPH
jgi:outer membrane protein